MSRTRAALLVAVVVAAGLAVRPPAAGAARHPAVPPALTLVDQAPAVAGTTPFSLELGVPSTLASRPGLALEVTVYGPLVTRSDFARVVGGAAPPGAALGSTGPLRLASLPAGAGGGTTRYHLAVGLVAGGAGPPGDIDGSAIDLGCAPGSCVDGVYPAVVTLLGRNGGVLGRLTTFITYDTGPQPSPLRVAVVLPVQAPAGLPDTPLAASQVTSLAELVAAVDRDPGAVTLTPSPETLQRLAASGQRGRGALVGLDLATASGSKEVLAQPYVPIDPAQLVASGLSGEIPRQLERGQRVLSGLGLDATGGPLVLDGEVGASLAQAVEILGAHQVVVASANLAYPYEKYTPATTSVLPLGHGVSVQAAAADPGYAAAFSAHPHDPGLAAAQLVADLNLTYEEQPGTPRGVILLPPPRWSARPAMVDALLSALAGGADPELQAVTLSTFFSTVPELPASSGQAPRFAPSGSGSLPRAAASTIVADRRQWAAFASAVQDGAGVVEGLNETLLATESSQLGRRGRQAALAAFHTRLSAQLAQLQLATDRTITLTSQTGALPVTLLSSAPYRVVGMLALSSDKLEFPEGAVRQVVLARSTTPIRVDVTARTSGDLPVTVTLVSPAGNLVLVRGELTVRSTATSLVGVVLSVLALAVLLAWWARTSIRRRRAAAERD